MQSPKLPVYNAGNRSTNSVCVTPAPFVPCIVSAELCARTGIIALKRAKEEKNAVVHDVEKEGKRAIVEMVELVYRN
jgi:hypothetical protein